MSGSVPTGAFNGRYAWVSYLGGDCSQQTILRITPNANPLDGSPFLVVQFAGLPQVGGVQSTVVNYYDGSTSVSVPGVATLSVAEPYLSTVTPTLVGSMSAAGSTMILSGDFSADYCSLFDQQCI